MTCRSLRGFTLIELMIAMVLGILLVGVCLATFQSNSNTYSAGEAIGRMQEGERVAFELMSRDIREAGGIACDGKIPIYNILNSPADTWYADFRSGVRGYSEQEPFGGEDFGSGKAERVAGTPAIELKSAVAGSVAISRHDPTAATITLGAGDHDFKSGEIAVACDFGQAAVFQITGLAVSPGSAPVITHLTGGTIPGNCSSRLGWSPVQNCDGTGPVHAFGCYLGRWQVSDCADEQPPLGSPDRWPALLAPMKSTRWFLARNSEGASSLYRATVRTLNGTPSPQVDEILANVSELEFVYLRRGSGTYLSASALTPADWATNDIIAVRVALTIASPHRVAGSVPKRRLEHVVAIRSNG